MDKEQLELLEGFVSLCRIQPSILKLEELKFFRSWLLQLGAKLPMDPETKHDGHSCCDGGTHDVPVEIESSEESDLDISNEGVIDGDAINYDQFMGDQTIEVTEDMENSADKKRNEALSQFSEGNYEEAINLFTEAIQLNPNCAMFYAKRASCYVKMKCPNAAIKDCNKGFELNPDSALAYKWRGISMKLLGKWEEAFSDLSQSLRLDYSDDTHEHMVDIETRVKLIREHRRKYERKREAKLVNEKLEKVRLAQEANAKVKKSHVDDEDIGDMYDMDDYGGGMGEMPDHLLNDPELVEDLKDPEVMAALTEIMSNPSSMLKHQANPKISKIMNKMQSKFGSGGEGGAGVGSGGKGGGGCCGGGHGCHMDYEESTAKPNMADELD